MFINVPSQRPDRQLRKQHNIQTQQKTQITIIIIHLLLQKL